MMNMTKKSILFSAPSFFRGMAATLDIGNTLTIYNESTTPEEADYKALYSDWSVIGENITYAYGVWGRDHVKK